MNLDLFITMQNADFRKAFGTRLKNLHKQKHWSQKELATKVDIRFQQLNKYEGGLNLPTAEMQIKLADALASSVDFLLVGHPADNIPLGNARLFQRFKEVESFNTEDQETIIKQQMRATLCALNDQQAISR